MTPKPPESAIPSPLSAFGQRVEAALDEALPAATLAPERMHEAMRYAVLGGGKRMRPLLVYAAGSALGAALEGLDPSACAVEIIHAYSLVHDDLPAMDDDDLRRGKPTCHRVFGEAMAILAGDALQPIRRWRAWLPGVGCECCVRWRWPVARPAWPAGRLSIWRRSVAP